MAMNSTKHARTHSAPSEKDTQRWLLAHDIADPKRLNKVWRLMRKEGQALQYSLYLLRGNRERIERLLDQLSPIIDKRTDDVRIYPLGENTRLWGLGNQFSDGGNIMTDEIIDRLHRTAPTNSSVGEPNVTPLGSSTEPKVGTGKRNPFPLKNNSD